MTTTIQQTDTYRQVMAWLRGGDATPDPQMWQYGPVFPRAYNRPRKDADDGTDEYYDLKTGHPNIFRYLENCFRLEKGGRLVFRTRMYYPPATACKGLRCVRR